jgi:hypothetical protein
MTDVGPCVLAPTRQVTSLKATLLASVFAPALAGAMSLATTSPALAQCNGPPGTPAPTQTQCLTAIAITGNPGNPGKPLQSFDISFVNTDRGEYYLADRAQAGIDIISTGSLTYLRTIGGFRGMQPNNITINNNISGPDGVTAHGKWLYAGDGDSTLKVMDLTIPCASPTCNEPIVASVPTGGSTRVDEMALTTDGTLLLAANNAEDPPFATLFQANGDNASNSVSPASIVTRVSVTNDIIPSTFGLSLEQPAWDPTTQRFYTSMPIIANNPPGCNYGQNSGPITCDGGLLVFDPSAVTGPTTVLGAFDPDTNTGVVPLHACSPNGSTVGPNGFNNLLLGCTPGNNPSDTTTVVINATTKNYNNIANITGSDEVWFNSGDNRYYLGASKSYTSTPNVCNAVQTSPPGGAATHFCAQLGVVDETSVLVETIPQSSNSHSVAADSTQNLIFVPQVCQKVGTSCPSGGDATTVGQQICGTTNGCVAVYVHGSFGKPVPPAPPPPPPPPGPPRR